MKIELLKSILVYPNDVMATREGSVVDVSEGLGNDLIIAGYAKKIAESPINKMAESPIKKSNTKK
jgi:hypothetical protein